MTTDFSRLYVELGLRPGCTLHALSRAYRRRVSELHPDRHAGEQPGSSGTMELADLISLYNRALQFHREYGRLPGAQQAGSVPQDAVPSARSGAVGADPAPVTHWRLWLLVAVVVVLWLELHSGAPDSPSTASAPSALPADPPYPPIAPEATATDLPAALEVGMDSDTVRALQGEPLRINDDIWEYGPSWIRVERGHVVDWYSSPLYRLKTRTPTPENADTN